MYTFVSIPFLVALLSVMTCWCECEAFLSPGVRPAPPRFVAARQSRVHSKKNVFTSSSLLFQGSSSTKSASVLNMAIHNFAPASSRDTFLYSAERPGNPPGKTDAVADETVDEWIAFMKDQGINRVIALLDENELVNYSDLTGLYKAGGLKSHVQPMREQGASDKILTILRDAESASEKVVVHCTGGIGRAGRVTAAWLVDRYGLGAQEATDETLAQATESGTIRKGNADMLTEWLGKA